MDKDTGSIPGQSMWDLLWTKWHWDRFFLEYFGFPLSISFHRYSIARKNEKKLIIFITGLHKKPQGCGASVSSAAGPFTTKTKHHTTTFFFKIVIAQLLKRFPAFMETNLNTLFKLTRHLTIP
jgi:hypothetical protein